MILVISIERSDVLFSVGNEVKLPRRVEPEKWLTRRLPALWCPRNSNGEIGQHYDSKVPAMPREEYCP